MSRFWLIIGVLLLGVGPAFADPWKNESGKGRDKWGKREDKRWDEAQKAREKARERAEKDWEHRRKDDEKYRERQQRYRPDYYRDGRREPRHDEWRVYRDEQYYHEAPRGHYHEHILPQAPQSYSDDRGYYPSDGAVKGGRLGALIGELIGGPDGANIGAGIGAEIGHEAD